MKKVIFYSFIFFMLCVVTFFNLRVTVKATQVDFKSIVSQVSENIDMNNMPTLNSTAGNVAVASENSAYGDTNQLVATANEGFEFSFYYDSTNTVLSTKPVYNFKTSENHSFFAHFKAVDKKQVLFIDSNNKLLGTLLVDIGQIVLAADVVKFENKLSLKPGYEFESWSQAFPLTVIDDIIVTATYQSIKLQTYNITALFEDETLISTQNALYGKTTTVDAPAIEGKHFSHWLINNKTVSYKQSYTLSVFANIVLTAIYLDAEPTEEIVSYLNEVYIFEEGKIYFFAQNYVPNNLIVVEQGILFLESFTIQNDLNLTFASSGSIRTRALRVSPNGEYAIAKLYNENMFLYSRSYIVVKENEIVHTVYGNLVEIKKYSINYHLDGGVNNQLNPNTYSELTLPFNLNNPTKVGYNFLGWYDNSNFSGSAITAVSTNSIGNIVLYAKWGLIEHTITYHLNGGVNSGLNLNKYSINTLPFTFSNPTRNGYSFLGWYENASFTGNRIYQLSVGSTGSKIFYAKWEATEYAVTYELNNGSWYSTSEDLKNDFLIDFYAYINPTENLMTFMHGVGKTSGYDGTWHSTYKARLYAKDTMHIDSSLPYFINQPSYNLKWLPFYDLLDVLINEVNPAQNLWSDTWAGLIRFRQYFIGELFTLEQLSRIPDSMPILKDYQKKYTLETLPVILPIATKEGYNFIGWFGSANFSGSIITQIPAGSTGNKTYYAKWEAITYTLTYELNSGSWYANKNSLSTDFLTDLYAYVNPSENLNTFMHGVGKTSGFNGLWYSNTTYRAKIYAVNSKTSNASLPYFINQPEYNIKWLSFFNLIDTLTKETNSTQSFWGSTYTGGIRLSEWITGTRYASDSRMPASSTIKQFTIESSTFTLPIPVRANSTFLGWYSNTSFSGSAITKVQSGTFGNTKVYAKWQTNVSGSAYIEPSYLGNATLKPGNQLIIRTDVYGLDFVDVLNWTSSNTSVATIDQDGVLRAVGVGTVIITIKTATTNLETKVGFTVYSTEVSDPLLQYLISLNTGILFTQNVYYIGYNGSYWNRIYNTVNTYLAAPKDTVINNTLSTSAANHPNRLMSSIQYVVIHDTGSASASSTALANSNWCTNPSNTSSSWHYTIGNDGVYQQMADNYVAWHAGDGSVTWSSTNTGVAATGDRPKVTIQSGNFAFNGVRSSIVAPGSSLNASGILTTIKNGYYYLGPTWYSSGYAKVVNKGGNSNGIGIETTVNNGSDVYWTWQKTAKLTADLLVKHNLNMNNVGFHQNFSGKVCPGTMINAGLKNEFLDLVAAEYHIRKNFNNYTITFTSHNSQFINNNGRVVSSPAKTTNVTYTITVNNGTTASSITLNALVPGQNTW